MRKPLAKGRIVHGIVNVIEQDKIKKNSNFCFLQQLLKEMKKVRQKVSTENKSSTLFAT